MACEGGRYKDKVGAAALASHCMQMGRQWVASGNPGPPMCEENEHIEELSFLQWIF